MIETVYQKAVCHYSKPVESLPGFAYGTTHHIKLLTKDKFHGPDQDKGKNPRC